MKLCKDCAYFGYELSASQRGSQLFCARAPMEAIHRHLVVGEFLSGGPSPERIPPERMRSDSTLCGPDAKLFEPKEDTNANEAV